MSNTASTIIAFMAIVGVMLMTLSTIVVSMPIARAQGHADPPIGLFGNPNDFRPGPPIPSCNAEFHQGPPNDLIKGCRDTP